MWKSYCFWCIVFTLLRSFRSQQSEQNQPARPQPHQKNLQSQRRHQACRIPPEGACADTTKKILSDGRWCLEIHPNNFIAPGRPLARHHIVADNGIAKTIAEIVPSNQSIIDIGAGIGQYQVWFMNNHKTFKRYLAYDGAPNVEEFTWGTVRYLNIAQQVQWYPHEISDWVLSLEVGEHLDKQYESVFIQNLHRVNTKGMWNGIPM
ncbi:hypothetical protein EON63_18335 [archaeon]|nr:MAG: hypothetical protein EON63_18335 [archaeon]